MSKRIFIHLLGLCLSWLLTSPLLTAQAQGQGQGQDQQNEQRGKQAGENEVNVSRREASELARRRYSGRVLNIELQGNRWRLRIDDDGTLINVFVDARTGEVSGPGR